MTAGGGPAWRAVGATAAVLLLVAIGLAVRHTPTLSPADLATRSTIEAPASAVAYEPGSTASAVDIGDVEPVSQVVATPIPPIRHAAAPWVDAVSAATGIGTVALRAYADATLRVAETDPACDLGWTTIAAIGAVESGHGTHGGARLNEDGRPSVPILGPALDGTGGTASVPAGVDEVGWTGDHVWAHAVGPMQFLPSTWRTWASDGDGDGASDPNDIDDAALATARYLCASGSVSGAGWRAAVFSYNHDEAYVGLVLETANRYADASGSVTH